ncbi:MAG: hypothetical protein IPH62_02475 [Ignavibacteriae bacterium]|nr:hypothetical protein [Ignavibacteriota bacterium]
MAEYKVKADNSKNFSLTYDEKLLGKLIYEHWYSLKANAELTNKQLKIEPKGFLGTTVEVKDSDKIYLSFTMSWNGNIVITSKLEKKVNHYFFKHKGIVKSNYLVLDENDQELLAIQPIMKWNKFNYEFSITSNENFEKLNNKEILLITFVHCSNYYLTIFPAIFS